MISHGQVVGDNNRYIGQFTQISILPLFYVCVCGSGGEPRNHSYESGEVIFLCKKTLEDQQSNSAGVNYSFRIHVVEQITSDSQCLGVFLVEFGSGDYVWEGETSSNGASEEQGHSF